MRFLTLAFGALLVLGSGTLSSVAENPSADRASQTRQVRRYGKIQGTVYWFGTPMPGATIFLEGADLEKSFKTLPNGYYEFKVPPGTYHVTAPGPWASEAFRTVRVTVEKGELELVDFWFW